MKYDAMPIHFQLSALQTWTAIILIGIVAYLWTRKD